METNDLIKSKLKPDFYLLLFGLYHKDNNLLEYLKEVNINYKNDLKELEGLGYIKITNEIILRSKALLLFEDNTKNSPEYWYDEWRNLFPEGINPNGYYYRGNKQEVLHKLKTFCKKNPKITKDEIINATKDYIERCQRTRSYMLLAHYFIDKQGVGSTLLTEIENLNRTVTKKESLNKML